MSKQTKPARRKRLALANLPKPAEQKIVSQPNLQTRKRILDNLHDTIGSCEDLFDQHGQECRCEVSSHWRTLFGSEKSKGKLYPFPVPL